jgi:hypothetical protein
MMARARDLLDRCQGAHLGFLDPVASTSDQELAQPTGDPNNPTLSDRPDWLHWHFGTHLRQITRTPKKLEPRYYACRSLSLPELGGLLGPLAGELATVNPGVFTWKPAPQKMSVKEDLEHLVKAERDHIVPGLTQALERIRSS